MHCIQISRRKASSCKSRIITSFNTREHGRVFKLNFKYCIGNIATLCNAGQWCQIGHAYNRPTTPIAAINKYKAQAIKHLQFGYFPRFSIVSIWSHATVHLLQACDTKFDYRNLPLSNTAHYTLNSKIFFDCISFWVFCMITI